MHNRCRMIVAMFLTKVRVGLVVGVVSGVADTRYCVAGPLA